MFSPAIRLALGANRKGLPQCVAMAFCHTCGMDGLSAMADPASTAKTRQQALSWSESLDNF